MLAGKNQIFMLVVVLYCLRLVAGYESELHSINYDNETSNVTCWYKREQKPRYTLEFALKGLTQNNNSAVHVEPGVYVLNTSVGDDSVDYRFYYMKNISVIGLSDGDLTSTREVSVIIQCYYAIKWAEDSRRSYHNSSL